MEEEAAVALVAPAAVRAADDEPFVAFPSSRLNGLGRDLSLPDPTPVSSKTETQVSDMHSPERTLTIHSITPRDLFLILVHLCKESLCVIIQLLFIFRRIRVAVGRLLFRARRGGRVFKNGLALCFGGEETFKVCGSGVSRAVMRVRSRRVAVGAARRTLRY